MLLPPPRHNNISNSNHRHCRPRLQRRLRRPWQVWLRVATYVCSPKNRDSNHKVAPGSAYFQRHIPACHTMLVCAHTFQSRVQAKHVTQHGAQ